MTSTPAGESLQIVEIGNEIDFQRLKEPWNRLVTAASGQVFLRHEWFDAAWAWRRADASLGLLCVFCSEQLVGTLPLLRPRRTSHAGRVLKFLTFPDTQFCDLLVDREREVDVCRALVEHLVATASQWDTVELESLAPDSVIERALLPQLSASGLASRLDAVDRNMFVDLCGTWDRYYADRSRGLRKSCSLAANRLSRAGGLVVDPVSGTPFPGVDLNKIVDNLSIISGRSCKQTTGISLDRSGPGAFITRLIALASAEGWLSVWLLKLDGQWIAMEYQLIHGGNVYALRADFDEATGAFPRAPI